jgi:restriction system protein
MARRSSFTSAILTAQRQAARNQAARQRSSAAGQREAARARAEYQRAVAADARVTAADARAAAAMERERKRLYAISRAADVAALNEGLDDRIGFLDSLLSATLVVDDYIDFASLKQPVAEPQWTRSDLEAPIPAPRAEQFIPPALSGVGKLFGKGKHEQAVELGQQSLLHAQAEHRHQTQARETALTQARDQHVTAVAAAHAEAERQHQEVDEFAHAFETGDPAAVVSYFTLVLGASDYGDGFPQAFKAAYVPESRQFVVEYDLPPLDAVPEVKAYKYVKSTDAVSETPRPATSRRALYGSVVAQVTLRTIHEVFEADRGRHVDTVVFNGMVDTIDPGSGKQIRPCLITVRTTRDVFLELDLSHVEPMACLKHLSAGVSKSPAELTPVRPVLEFDMVDPRFIDESDALSTLDQRPNLMELTPNEFESLIQNLFAKMGLDTKQTRPSRDGGVDCVAFDPRPIFGGKVVIQAKRYKNTVGVSAVRDLFGTLQNEGASKGILVATSGYGQASYEFAQNKPIELIDGSNLLYLLAEHAGVEARIVPPDTWVDPIPDAPGEVAVQAPLPGGE